MGGQYPEKNPVRNPDKKDLMTRDHCLCHSLFRTKQQPPRNYY